MASGSFYGSTNNQYIDSKIAWSSTPNTAGNYSTVTATLTYSRNNTGYTTSGTFQGYLYINGNGKYESKSISITHNSDTVVITHTVTVYHDSNGSKSISIYATGGIPGTSFTSTSISSTVALDNIPRASSCTFPSSMPMGSASTISITRADSSFTHTIEYYFGTSSGTIASKTTSTSVSFTPPLSLGERIPNDYRGWGTLRLITYNSGGSQIGYNDYSMVLTIPDNYKPTISSISTDIANSTIKSKFAAYVQGKTGVKTTINVSTTNAYGATVKSYTTTIDGITYTGQTTTSGNLNKVGSISISSKITDSRGRSHTASTSVTVVAYTAPNIRSFSATRNATTNTTVNCSYSYAIASVSSKNDRTLKYRHRALGGTWGAYTSITLSSYDTTGSFSITGLAIASTYEIELALGDYFTTTSVTRNVLSLSRPFNIKANNKSVAIGKMAETDDVFDVGYKSVFSNHIELGTTGQQQRVQFNGKGANAWNVGIYGGNTTDSPFGIYDWTNNRSVFTYDNNGHVQIPRSIFANAGILTTAKIGLNLNHATVEQQIRFENASSEGRAAYLYKGASNSGTVLGIYDGTKAYSVWQYLISGDFNINRPLYTASILNGGLSRVPTLADFRTSKVKNGYIDLPSGLTLQWGYLSVPASTASVGCVFPANFPNACLNVTLCNEYTNSKAVDYSVGYLTKTQFTVYPFFTSNEAVPTVVCGMYWFAVGY